MACIYSILRKPSDETFTLLALELFIPIDQSFTQRCGPDRTDCALLQCLPCPHNVNISCRHHSGSPRAYEILSHTFAHRHENLALNSRLAQLVRNFLWAFRDLRW